MLLALATDPVSTAEAEASEIWQNVPAVAAGRYTAVPALEARAIGDGFNALSYDWVLPRLVELVDAAARGQGRPMT